MSDLVTVSIAAGIADIRFNRPHKHNSLALELPWLPICVSPRQIHACR